ncbi:reverse transcriptase domain-containing protein [Tanacetum coccineum]
MTRSSTNELFTPYKEPEREFRSSRRHFKTLSLDELRSPDFNLLSDQEYSEEEEAEAMAETMEQYMSKTRTDYGSGVARPKIDNKDQFELKGQFLKELRENTFSGSDNKDANEHIEKVLKIVDLFHVPNITVDQLMLREDLKTKFLNKYCPPGRTTKKMEEINNFQQEPDETLYQAWERFKELLMKCPQHYLTEMQETAADAKIAIQEMAKYSQKWHNGTSRGRSTKTSDGLAAIQAQLNNLGREIKKVNEKVYASQVGCKQCKGPQYTKDCPLKEEGKPLEEAYYMQFGGTFQGGGYGATAPRHEENFNLIKEIRATTDAAIRNQGASIKTLEIQIGQMSKVLQEKGF